MIDSTLREKNSTHCSVVKRPSLRDMINSVNSFQAIEEMKSSMLGLAKG